MSKTETKNEKTTDYAASVVTAIKAEVQKDVIKDCEMPTLCNMDTCKETGFAVILLDIAHFLNVERFKEHAAAYAEMLKNSRTATGVKEIYLPGEIEARLFEENKIKGLDFSDALVAELEDLARQSGALGKDGALADLLA